MKKILITGGNGKMGRCIAEGLRKAGYRVLSTSRTPNAELDIVKLDIRDREACINMTREIDVIIHMGYYMGNDNFREEQVPTNIIGAWNLYEGAVKNGVKRIIFASSNHAVGFYQRTDTLREETMQRPDSPYALTKCFNEICGRYLSDRCGISVINVRIGTFTRTGVPDSIRNCRTWISRRDTQQLFQKCVEADESIRFLTIYGTSANTDGDFDISSLKEKIGYEPLDNGHDYLDEILKSERPERHDTYEFLGGGSFLRYPFTGETRMEDLETLRSRHVKRSNQ